MRSGFLLVPLAILACGTAASPPAPMPDAGVPDTGPPQCSPQNPEGDCPQDERCVDGACAPIPECGRDAHEWNDVRSRATPLDIDAELEGAACEDDVDWFKVAVPPGKLVNVHATVGKPRTSANLDAYAYDSQGKLMGGLWEGIEPHPMITLANETTEEGFGFYSGAESATYYVKIVPRDPSYAGTYKISARATEWKDGPKCEDEYDFLECTSGQKGAQTLWMWPYMSPQDKYVGGGYLFSQFSTYRYLRRETLMLMRYALHEVSRQFPGTKPLGLADMCQRDGITPGYDVNKPRHPPSSHDQGGNIDVAYFSTLADNKVRVICDAMGGSQTPDKWYCLPSAAMTHVVDLPRTVYFVVALARYYRFRVAGVDQVIGPIMEQTAQKMRDDGTITQAEYDAYKSHVTWGSGWPAHHHHLHLSLSWL